jgi:transposase-like protein
MVTITICCQHCGSNDLVRDGHASNGMQRYLCKSCKKQSRENPAVNRYIDERR